MHPLIYDVAVSIDGFIAGPSEDVSRFPHSGAIVDDYQRRLQNYKTCLMGRRTYEFGYRYGLEPGQNPYPHMRSIVLSESITLPESSDVELLSCVSKDAIEEIKQRSDGDIYLCGGGELANWMLANKLIDIVRIKRAPIILGSGIKIFGEGDHLVDLTLVTSTDYQNGALFQEFKLNY
ncbi:MAG: dihydrofolate reductase [Rhizobiaceae bacterium]|nr:dihydrofolate reductase [Rhizobiaceae bacterium]